jgi:AcrR family transcriptional regulator
VRADAARNLDAVLRAAARLVADDPSASISAIAEAAGVGKRTIYRRFESREELLTAIFRARLDALEVVVDEAMADQRPFPIALHSFAAGGIRVSREWPVDIRTATDEGVQRRRGQLNTRIGQFLRRGQQEGLLRTDLPAAWPDALLRAMLRTAAQEFQEIAPPEAAELVTDTLLHGLTTKA